VSVVVTPDGGVLADVAPTLLALMASSSPRP
jgi:hypothetical protein